MTMLPIEMTPVERWNNFRSALAEQAKVAPDLTSVTWNSVAWPAGRRWATLHRLVTAAAGTLPGRVETTEFTVRCVENGNPRLVVRITNDEEAVAAHHAELATGGEDVKVVMTVTYWGQSRAAYRDMLLHLAAQHSGNKGRALTATIVGEQDQGQTRVRFYAHAVAPNGELLVCIPRLDPPEAERFFHRAW